MILIISYCFIVLHTYCIEYCNYFEIFTVKDKIVNFVCSKFIKGNNWYALSALQPAHASSKPFVYVVFMKSRETQITMVKWTNAGGQTKRAKERSFVYRPSAWWGWRNVKSTTSSFYQGSYETRTGVNKMGEGIRVCVFFFKRMLF